MQNPRAGMRWIVATIASINITIAAHVASVAPVAPKNDMVVTAQHLANKIGVEVPKRGDNTVDTVVAVGYALAVVYPTAGNLNGGGLTTIQLADGRGTFLDFREVAPKATTVNMHLNKGGDIIKDVSTRGHLAVGMPGTVSGMEYAREKYGTIQRAVLIAPAITLADKGFVLDQGDVDMLHTSTKGFQEGAISDTIFLNKGQPFQVSEKLVQHDLAKTLREINRHGTDSFCKGWVGQAIAVSSKTGSGLATQNDLVSYKMRGLAPVECDYRGYHVVPTSPPSSDGVITCKVLNALEDCPLKDLGWHSAQAAHYQIEAMRHTHMDRNSYLGGPNFVKNPLSRLLNKDYAAKTCAVIDLKKAGVSKDTKPGVEPHKDSNTTYYSTTDKYSNAMSATYTLNNWSDTKVTTAKTDVILSDGTDDLTAKVGVSNLYDLTQGEASSIAPGKRPLSSMSPITTARDGEPIMVAGAPGGDRTITVVTLTMINAIGYGINVQEAADMPRSYQQWLLDVTNVETYALSEDTRKILTSMGHSLGMPQLANHLAAIIVGAPSLGGKPIDSNRFYDANDPRRSTGLIADY